jgi:hypothetical protein
MTPRFIPDLIDIEQELFELPQKARTLYFWDDITLEPSFL